MKKIGIDFGALPNPNGYIFTSALAAEMAANLTSKTIRKGYTTIVEKDFSHHGGQDAIFLFMGLLHTMCQDYIKSMGLEADAPKYKQLVNNLAMLTGLNNQDYCLDAEEMAYCIENGVIPINLDAMFADVDHSDMPKFIKKQRFDDIVNLAVMIMTHYESPADPDKPEQSNKDGMMNLLLCGHKFCAEIYQTRKDFAEYCRRNNAESIRIEEQPGGGKLDFDL